MRNLLLPTILCVICVACQDADDDPIDSGTDGGGQLDGGRPSYCELPPEVGPCDALIHRYYFDVDSQSCRHFVYGGCEGNENNFASLDECRTSCREPPSASASCEVEGVVYPSGSDGVGDPLSCNTCACEDGALTTCTEIGCPEPCPEGTTYGTSCVECGPVDQCEVVRIGCLPSCEDDDDCSSGGACHEGVCRTLCG